MMLNPSSINSEASSMMEMINMLKLAECTVSALSIYEC